MIGAGNGDGGILNTNALAGAGVVTSELVN